MKTKANSGFTLLELIATIAIAGVLMAVGIPSFATLIKEGRISAQYTAMQSALYQARSAAIKGKHDISVCPKRAPGENQCGGSDDWENGWIVFVQKRLVPGAVNLTISPDEEILSVSPQLKNDNTVTVMGSATNAVGNVRNVSSVRFMQNGTSTLSTGSVVICDAERGANYSRVLNIVQTGGMTRGQVRPGSDAPRDVFNRPVTCP